MVTTSFDVDGPHFVRKYRSQNYDKQLMYGFLPERMMVMSQESRSAYKLACFT
jgi:hypothetical protein